MSIKVVRSVLYCAAAFSFYYKELCVLYATKKSYILKIIVVLEDMRLENRMHSIFLIFVLHTLCGLL